MGIIGFLIGGFMVFLGVITLGALLEHLVGNPFLADPPYHLRKNKNKSTPARSSRPSKRVKEL